MKTYRIFVGGLDYVEVMGDGHAWLPPMYPGDRGLLQITAAGTIVATFLQDRIEGFTILSV